MGKLLPVAIALPLLVGAVGVGRVLTVSAAGGSAGSHLASSPATVDAISFERDDLFLQHAASRSRSLLIEASDARMADAAARQRQAQARALAAQARQRALLAAQQAHANEVAAQRQAAQAARAARAAQQARQAAAARPAAPRTRPTSSPATSDNYSNSSSWAASARARRVRDCESSDNYGANTGNGYYGAYQFSESTWQAVGGHGYPQQNSHQEQDYRAYRLWQRSGWSAWSCA